MKQFSAAAGTMCITSLLVAMGCSSATWNSERAEDPRFLRSLADTATVAAVARRGARVCREMQVGIAERDWLRGGVVEAEGTRVAIRIEDAGRFEHVVGGAKVSRGAVVRDDAAAWTPCR